MIRRQTSLGFDLPRNEEVEERLAYDEMRKKLLEALKKVFRPEFINRVDAIIVFHALTKEQIVAIVDLELAKVAERLVEHEMSLEVTKEGRERMAELGYDPEMGARPLKRVIQNEVEDKLSDALLASRFQSGDCILVDIEDEQIVLHTKKVEPEDEEQEAVPAG